MPAPKKARVSQFTAFKKPASTGNKEGRWNEDELEDDLEWLVGKSQL